MVPQNVFSRGGSGPPAYITQNTFVKIVLFHPLAEKPPRGRICTKFGTAVGVADVITCNKFLVIGRGVDSVGSKIALSH